MCPEACHFRDGKTSNISGAWVWCLVLGVSLSGGVGLLDDGLLDVGLLDVGLLDVGCWIVGCWMVDVGCWMLDVRCWTFDVRCSVFDVPCFLISAALRAHRPSPS